MLEVSTMIIYAILVVFLDKIITLDNIKTVMKNQPSKDALSIEKNPLAQWLFRNYGLATGTILMFIVSLLQFLIAFLFLRWLSAFFWSNPGDISFYIIFGIYCLTIINNLFFLYKFSKVKEK